MSFSSKGIFEYNALQFLFQRLQTILKYLILVSPNLAESMLIVKLIPKPINPYAVAKKATLVHLLFVSLIACIIATAPCNRHVLTINAQILALLVFAVRTPIAES